MDISKVLNEQERNNASGGPSRESNCPGSVKNQPPNAVTARKVLGGGGEASGTAEATRQHGINPIQNILEDTKAETELRWRSLEFLRDDDVIPPDGTTSAKSSISAQCASANSKFYPDTIALRLNRVVPPEATWVS